MKVIFTKQNGTRQWLVIDTQTNATLATLDSPPTQAFSALVQALAGNSTFADAAKAYRDKVNARCIRKNIAPRYPETDGHATDDTAGY